jgi:hypothetical protein
MVKIEGTVDSAIDHEDEDDLDGGALKFITLSFGAKISRCFTRDVLFGPERSSPRKCSTRSVTF